jgi:hypothetical protein
MAGQDTHYETAEVRDKRQADLTRTVAVDNPAWMTGFIAWLRGEANMRSASIAVACEAVKARLDAGSGATNDLDAHMTVGYQTADMTTGGWNRRMIDAACQRADEPGEILAYWTSHFGRAIPKPVKRGVADAVRRLYTEYSLAKYDGTTSAYRFGDVIDLVHPAPAPDKPWQADLFRYALNRRHGRGDLIPNALPMLNRRAWLTTLPTARRRSLLTEPGAAELLAGAGMTWEALAGWLQGPMDAAAWEAIIPSMGYMALLRNLANFNKAKISGEVAAQVATRLADAVEVSRSRQLPLRFLAAYRAVSHDLRWAWPLEQALCHSLNSIPALTGRTLIMVDTSKSMEETFSKDGELGRWHAAALFGIALATRCETADIVSFASTAHYIGQPSNAHTKHFPLTDGESILRALDRWQSGGYFLGGGTETAKALRREFKAHDRVVVLTDEQASQRDTLVAVDQAVPANIPMYTANLAGYEAGHAPSGRANRHTFGGLTDEMFKVIPLLEARRSATWPWDAKATA